MPFPFAAFSIAEQKSLFSQSAGKFKSVCDEITISIQIRQPASIYPSRFEETVAEGKPKGQGWWLSLPACARPIATGASGNEREEPQHALGVGGLYVG